MAELKRLTFVRKLPHDSLQASINVRTCLCHNITHEDVAAADACERMTEKKGISLQARKD